MRIKIEVYQWGVGKSVTNWKTHYLLHDRQYKTRRTLRFVNLSVWNTIKAHRGCHRVHGVQLQKTNGFHNWVLEGWRLFWSGTYSGFADVDREAKSREFNHASLRESRHFHHPHSNKRELGWAPKQELWPPRLRRFFNWMNRANH